MEVILKKSMVGTEVTYRSGDLIEVSDEEGQRLIDEDFAMPASEGTPKRKGKQVPKPAKSEEPPKEVEQAPGGGSETASNTAEADSPSATAETAPPSDLPAETEGKTAAKPSAKTTKTTKTPAADPSDDFQ